jgi:exopolyphosphatase/pppGpp-phosphohydrolase
VLGSTYDLEQLEALVEILEKVPGETLVRSHGVSADRAHTLLGGTLVLAEMCRRLGSPLEVAQGGLREGAALALAQEAKAAA